MPILKKNKTICHFAHIPKCGGTSIEAYCVSIGISIAFLDTNHLAQLNAQKWSVSSPQHIDGATLSRLFPPSFFDFCFTVVRNPVDRFLSAFKFHVSSLYKISPQQDVNDFIAKNLREAANTLGAFDNHFMPQVNFFIPGMRYKVFKLDMGLQPVKKLLDTQFLGGNADIKIQHVNESDTAKDLNPLFHINEQSHTILRDIYAQDYEQLGFK